MKNWLSFKLQDNGDYKYTENGVEISYSSDGLLKCSKNGANVYEHQYGSGTEAMLNASDVFKKYVLK